MPAVQVTTKEQMQKALDEHEGKALVDFHATWCGPCKNIAPYVKAQCQKAHLLLIKIDVDQAPQLSQEFGITAMPTFVGVKGKYNNVVVKKTGGSQDVVNQVIAQLK